MNIRQCLPYIPPTWGQDVRNNEKEVLPEPHLETRQQQALDALLSPGVSPEARKRCYQILQVFPSGVLENLKQHGLKITITQGKPIQGMTGSGAVAVGGYNPQSREIVFDEAVLMTSLGRHVTTHEVIHAIDHMRGERLEKGALRPVLASTRDKDLHAIYARYTARGAVEFVDQLRYQVRQADSSLPAEAHLDTEDNWGRLSVDYQRGDGQEMFKIEQQPKEGMGGIQGVMQQMFSGVPGKTRDLPTTEMDVEMLQGKQAHVVQEGTTALVVVPEGAAAFTGDVWSEYAHRSGQIEEYEAEAFSNYLEGGSKRSDLKDFDPDMYAYTEKTLQEEFNLRP